MSIEIGTLRAEQVTEGMELLHRGVWRPVLADAEIVVGRKSRRARITLGGADTSVVEMVAHSIVRVRAGQKG